MIGNLVVGLEEFVQPMPIRPTVMVMTWVGRWISLRFREVLMWFKLPFKNFRNSR